MAIAIISVSGNQNDLRLEVIFQLSEQILIEAHRVLLDDFVGHNDLVATLYHVAAVHNDVSCDAFEVHFFADALIIRDKVLESIEVVRVICILQEAALIELDGHIIPRPDMLLGLGERKSMQMDTRRVEFVKNSLECGHIVLQAFGQVHSVGLFIRDHIGYCMLQCQIRVL